MRDLSNCTAVITGAASGMGYAFAERFAAEGMNVVLADIEADALKAAVTRLEHDERTVAGIEVNTMQRESVESLRDQAIDRFGNIHVLCNNAGVTSSEDGGARSLWEIPDSTWDWVLGVNFYGVLYGIQSFLPHMIEHGEPGHCSQHSLRRWDRCRLRRVQRVQARRPVAERGPLSRPLCGRLEDLGQRALSRLGTDQPARR